MSNGVEIRYGDFAPEAKENFVPSSNESKFNTLSQLQQYNLNFPNYANPCELYSVVLDGTALAFPSVPENANLGLWSERLSDENGNFTNSQGKCTLNGTGDFDNEHAWVIINGIKYTSAFSAQANYGDIMTVKVSAQTSDLHFRSEIYVNGVMIAGDAGEYNIKITGNTTINFEKKKAELIPYLGYHWWEANITMAEQETTIDPIILTLESEGQYTSQGLTLTFDTYNNIYPTRLSIKWLRITDEGITILDEKEFTPDNAVYFCRNFVENYNKVVITFYSINMPKNRLKLRVIDYGYGTIFRGGELRNTKIIQEIDPISTQISINTADFALDSHSDMEYSFQQKQPLSIFFNGELKATTFVKSSKRRAKFLWDIQSEDYIGLMDSIPYYGGIYNNTKAVDILDDIFAVAKVPYSLDNIFADATVTGYIPFTTCRDALMQVAFAIQAVVDTSGSEVVKVFALPRNLISNDILGEYAKQITENTVSNIGYICPVGNEIIFGFSKEIGLEKQKNYTLSFKAWSNQNYSISWDLWTAPNVGDENLLPQEWFDVNETPKEYQWTFNVNTDFVRYACLRFLNVMQDGTINNIESPIYITDIQIEDGKNKTDWSTSKRPKLIPLNRIKQGQNFVNDETVTGVEVAVHSYKPIAETVDVYDASESGSGQNIFVRFAEPLHDLSITNGTIIQSHTNYAIINANENSVLTGQQYEHTTQTRRKNNPVVLASEIEKVVSIENATLVSSHNIDNIIEKCYNWLTRTNTINLDIVEGKHIEYGDGQKYPNIVTYDEPVNIGDLINTETEYLGLLKEKLNIKQSYNLNGNILVKKAVLK